MHEMAHAHPRASLRHPLFLSALTLLLLNDHVLKGAGILPGELTGKLSDFAGLIVAPTLLVALTGARSRAARALVFGAIAVAFAALQLSPRLAAVFDAVLGAIGVEARTWSDPSDLIALSVLPLAWWLVGRGDRTPSGAHADRGAALALQRVVSAVAFFACVATSRLPVGTATWTTGAWIHNRTGGTVDVRLRWIEEGLDCSAFANADLARAIHPAIFGRGITFRLDPGKTLPIEPAGARAALDGGTTTGTSNACDVVRISIDGAPDTIAFFRATRQNIVPTWLDPVTTSWVDPDAIAIQRDEHGALWLEAGASFRTAVLLDRAPDPPAECPDARSVRVAASELDGEATFRVASTTVLPDGCTALDLVDDRIEDIELTYFLCVPEDFVPFAVDDRIRIERVAEGWMRIAKAETGLPAVDVIRDAERVDAHGMQIRIGADEPGCGQRLACGAYVQPARIMVSGGRVVEVDTLIDGPPSDTVSTRAIVTRAERVVVARPDCDPGRTTTGTRLDVVILRAPIPTDFEPPEESDPMMMEES
jgi:hypothetical protein